MNTVNNFVQKDKMAAWKAIPATNRKRSLTKLIHAAEETAAHLSQNFKPMTEIEINASDLGRPKESPEATLDCLSLHPPTDGNDIRAIVVV